jgi:Na+-driven multidrug efflux pump
MMIVQYVLRAPIIHLFTDVPEVQQKAISVAWLISFNTFPDLYKGMLKGLIGALGLQHKAVWVNLFA